MLLRRILRRGLKGGRRQRRGMGTVVMKRKYVPTLARGSKIKGKYVPTLAMGSKMKGKLQI